ncbi:MAG TPA: FkbM family methyltransferase [Anaerolineales bacterium]|nr:FkbM family methyltransferase [Anaerolineales bacterium]
MAIYLKKTARTLMTFFPSIKDWSYSLKRAARNLLNLTFEEDFNAIKMIADTEGALYLDVGGNQGAVIDILLLNKKNCSVISFEPNPEVYAKAYSRFKNNPRVQINNFGLGKEAGEFKLYVPEYRGYKFDGLGSLDSKFDDRWLAESVFFYDPKYLEMHEVVCRIKRLDDLGLEPLFLKVDVEGFEMEVLLGGAETIQRARPIILMESVEKDGEIMRYLEKFGYRIYKYGKGVFHLGEQGSPNSFLMTDDKLSLFNI